MKHTNNATKNAVNVATGGGHGDEIRYKKRGESCTKRNVKIAENYISFRPRGAGIAGPLANRPHGANDTPSQQPQNKPQRKKNAQPDRLPSR